MHTEAAVARSFKLHIKCGNCRHDSAKVLQIPEVDDAPQDVDELLDSGCMQQIGFECTRCGSQIGRLVAVTKSPGTTGSRRCSLSAEQWQ
jgi:hypothetical protein